LLRDFYVVGVENDGAIRIADFARGPAELDVRVRGLSIFGVAPLDPHFLPLSILNFLNAGGRAEVPLDISRRQVPRDAPERTPEGVVPHP
jgi:hypothetical protein